MGLSIMDSIICVAVMTSRFFSRAMPDHALLQRRHDGVADLHREIAARHHDAVGGIEYLVQRGNRLGALDLRDRERACRPPCA